MGLDIYLCTDADAADGGRKRICLFATNITHNLIEMAEKAGIYKCIWRPEEVGANYAEGITLCLGEGLKLLKDAPDYFRKFDSPNGWDTYDVFVAFVEEYMDNCMDYPKAYIEVDRR